MKRLFKKILLSNFVIVALLFISNNVFATNYTVNIAVVGNKQVGKTQIINRISGLPFQTVSDRSDWTHGAYGMEQRYQIDGDTFECNYYDAPGYLRNDDVTIEAQIDSNAIRNAHIAIIVMDPKQKSSDPRYVHSFDEALKRHADHIRHVNNRCRVIVVANKKDELDPTQLANYRKKLGYVRDYYDDCEIDGLFTSAKTNEGIAELKSKIFNLLRLNKGRFPTFAESFCICKNDGKKQRRDKCVAGYDGDLYCSEGCLRVAEAKPCSYEKCTDKRQFLRVKGEGIVSSETGKMYCSSEHMKKAEDGCTLL